MSEARKLWYKNNPEKAIEKSKKMQITKILNGTISGKNNPNYGSGKFTGIPYEGPAWNKGKTKETNPTLKLLSEANTNEKNPNWKGDKVSKNPLHLWIRRHKPKSEICEVCGINKPYDLANISGKYKRDINDFKWSCRKCHMKEDGRIKNLKNQKEVN